MPYGKSRYGISYYGQLELPLFEKVGALLRYTPPSDIFGIIRAIHPDYPLTLQRTTTTLNWVAHRYGGHAVGLSVHRGPAPQTMFGLVRTENYIQLQLNREFFEPFEEIFLVRNETDLTRN